MSDWISVDNKLPEIGVDVIVCHPTLGVFSAYIRYTQENKQGSVIRYRWGKSILECDCCTHEGCDLDLTAITNWMPLPEGPKDE
jgi:uncharacterized protein DUF551